MSTISLSQSDVIRAQRALVSGKILILSGLVIIAILLLVVVISTANADPAGRAVLSQNSTAPSAVPVPTPPAAVSQTISTETTALGLEERSNPSVIAVPVPTPPGQ